MRMVIQKDKTCFNNRCLLLMKTHLYHSLSETELEEDIESSQMPMKKTSEKMM